MHCQELKQMRARLKDSPDAGTRGDSSMTAIDTLKIQDYMYAQKKEDFNREMKTIKGSNVNAKVKNIISYQRWSISLLGALAD